MIEMKTSLKRLQKFAALRHEKRAHNNNNNSKQHHSHSLAHDDLARATQDMNDMRDCYDRLLSAAAATTNSVFEFSESLCEMGDCLLEKTALNDDEESGKVLLLLGKVQFELQKFVDEYRSHIIQTITVPSESLLNELCTVEEMKKRCDGKRGIYEDLMEKQNEKGRTRSNKGECFPSHQLQEAYDEYEEEANMFVFRMKSLKQGQSRSLLTQASRHHAAQLSFFKKALRSLESIDPHVRLVAEHQHIDYQISEPKDLGVGLFGDDDDDESNSSEDNDTEDGSGTHTDGELSFEYGQHGPVQEASSIKNLMELDGRDAKFCAEPRVGAAKEISQNRSRNSFSFQREVREISKSEPLYPQKKLISAERLTQMRPSPSRKFTSYVLPTPDETKIQGSGKLGNGVPQRRQAASNLWHSSPLNQNKYEKFQANDKLSGPIILDTESVLKESNKTKASRLPPPLSEGLSFQQFDPTVTSYAKKVKRQAFSGPLTGSSWPNNPRFSVSGPIASPGYPPPFSGSLSRPPLPQAASTPNLSSRVSPMFVSSPKISELHELPRPPAHLAARGPSNRITQSGPLMSKRHEISTARISRMPKPASTLPMPPQALPRSYSIPSGGPTEVALHRSLESPQNTKMADDFASPPLTPMLLQNIQPVSDAPQMIIQPVKFEGNLKSIHTKTS